MIGELSSNSGQIRCEDVEQLASATVCLGMECLGSFGVWAGPSRDVQPPAVFDVCSAMSARQPANERGLPVPHVPRVALTPFVFLTAMALKAAGDTV